MKETVSFQNCLPLRGRWLFYFLNGFPVAVVLLGLPWVWPRHIIEGVKGPVGLAKTQIGSFKMALHLYRLDHDGRCPTTREGLQALGSEPAGAQPGRWRGPYLNDITWIPLDPWQHAYRYDSPGPRGEPCRIVCFGADGLPGGEGMAADLVWAPIPEAR